jgi:formylglycine-generating enzyme required for sulfatase activity
LHFEHADERNYCEGTLNIQANNLPFVGLVTVGSSGLPEEILYRIDQSKDPRGDAQMVFAKARGQSGPAVTSVPSGPALTGQETTNPSDGSTMVLIPAGPFTMGSALNPSESPAHTLNLPAYYIGKNDVTNAQYRRFEQATHHETAGDWEGAASQYGDQAPVVNVSWSDAVAYCKWAGGRLPTEAEWEKAARGPDRRRYPWGNEWDPSRCRNSVESPATGPAVVGSYSGGASPYGCMDMAGNVWQWCSSQYRPYPYTTRDGRESLEGDSARVMRGGSWFNVIADVFRSSHRVSSRITDYGNNIGFRMARSR